MKTQKVGAVYRIKDGKVEALAGGPLSLAGLGPRETVRASNIEFNAVRDLWEVSIKGTVVHAEKDYDAALQWERDYFNTQLASK